MSNDKPNSPVLCEATYRAVQTSDAVIIYAQGEHGTTGYQVFFEQSPIRIFPPQFSLMHVEPTGIVGPAFMPFSVQVSFPAAESVERVMVHDANGAHDVPVEQLAAGGMQPTEIVAIRTRSGSIVGIQETLTVYADGTLHLVEQRFNRDERRQVPPHQLQPLQAALARPEWQDVEPFYGHPVPDGFTIGMSGGGKQTGFADPSSTPVELPAILHEVLGHVAALWPSDDASPIPPRALQPNVFDVRGDDLRITYDATGSEHVVEYHDAQRDHIFRGAEIETLESDIGTMLTVPLRFIPDPLELTLTQRLTFTLLLPKIVLEGTSSSFETLAIRTSHRASDGPALSPGSLQQYELLILQGVARLTEEEPASTHGLPPQIFKH